MKAEQGSKQAWETNLDIFIVDSRGSTLPKDISVGNLGADSVPVYSPCGNYLAWLEMRTRAYESDKNNVLIYNLATGTSTSLTRHWDRSASSIQWSLDSKYLYVTAEEHGHVKVFKVKRFDGSIDTIIDDQTQSSLNVIEHKGTESLLLLRQSAVAPSDIYLFDGKESSLEQITFVNQERLDSLLMSEPEAFWFEGAHGDQVMVFLYF